MKNNFKSILMLFIFLFSDSRAEIKAIIFDFGGVLANTSEVKFASEIGIKNLLSLGLANTLSLDFSNLGLKEKVLEIMSEIEQQKPCDNGLLSKHGDTELPEIMCKWLRGEVSGQDANKTVQEFLKSLPETYEKIKSSAEKEVLSNIVRIMFDSRKLAEFTSPITVTLDVLKELKDCKENNYQDRYKFLILSNWTSESFDMLSRYTHMQDVFKYFNHEDIFLSGFMHVMKPSNSAYEKILGHIKVKYDIKPEECLMIDDQPENILAATKYCNMQGILVDKNCSNLRSELVKLKLLPERQSSFFSSLVPFSWS